MAVIARAGVEPATGEKGQRRRDWWLRAQPKVVPYVFIAPKMVVFVVFLVLPIIFATYLSLTDWPLIGTSGRFVGLGNYVEMFTSASFWQAFANTMVFAVGTVPVSIGLGLLVALGLNRQLPGRTLLRGIFFVPFVISMVAVALMGTWIFNEHYGVVNHLLNAVGIESVPWLSSERWAMLTLVVETYWIRLGFCMIIYLAGLQGIPAELYEAARIDGASPWREFTHITWPLLRPTTFVLIILNVAYSLHVFDLIYIQTNGGPGFATTVLVQYVYEEAFVRSRAGYASAIGLFLYLLLMAFTVVQWRLSKQGDDAV